MEIPAEQKNRNSFLSKLYDFWKLIILTGQKWGEDNIPWLSAALAYYTLFSLAPIFIIVVVIGGAFFGEEAVKGQIVEYLGDLIGLGSARAIQNMIETGQSLATFSIGNIVGLVIIWFAATNAFSQLKNTMNAIWVVPAKEGHWVGTWVKGIVFTRVMSILMVLMIGVLILVLVIIDISLSMFDEILREFVPAFDLVYLWRIGNILISFFVTFILFAVLYIFLPDTKIVWGDVWHGALISSFLFTAGKTLISYFLGSSQMISLFGAASSFVVILVWVYYSNQIFFLGAVFAHNYAEKFGSRARARRGAREEAVFEEREEAPELGRS